MKTFLPFSSTKKIFFLAALPFLGSSVKAMNDSTIVNHRAGVEEDKVEVKSHAVSRNNSFVKIYPGIIKRKMYIRSRKFEGDEISMLVFDKCKNLVKQYLLKENDLAVVEELDRGKYTYSIFSDAVEVANGNFDIR